MAKKVCCCRIATWTMIISWLKIIFHVIYIILLTLSLMGLVGEENLAQTMKKHQEYDRVIEYFHKYIVFYLFCLMGYNIIGLPLNIVLLRGAIQRNERKLTIWLYYSLCNIVVMFPYVMWRLISKESITHSAIRLAVNYLFEFFCLWGVYALVKEIKQEKNESSHSFSCSPTVMMIREAEESAREPSPEPRKTDPFADYNLT